MSTEYHEKPHSPRGIGLQASRGLLLFALTLAIGGCRIETTGLPGTMPPTATSNLSTLPIQLRWCISDETSLSKPIYSNGLVFVIAGAPDISPNPLTKTPFSYRAYNANDGTLAWEKKMEDRQNTLLGTPGYWAIYKDWLIDGSSKLTVMEAITGIVLWTAGGSVFRGFTIGDDKIFVATDDMLDAYEVATGTILWRSAGPTRNTAERPLYDAENNLLIGNYVNYYVYDPDTGAIVHQTSSLAVLPDTYRTNTGLMYKGKVYYGNRVFDASTGKVLHTRQFSNLGITPFATDNTVLLNGYTDMVAEDANSYSILWRYQPLAKGGESLHILEEPTALNSVVYIMLSDATIRAMDLATGQEIGFWQGTGIVDRTANLTPFIAGLEVGDGMLFASFGTNQLCAFE